MLTEEVYGQYRLIITLVEIFSFISIPGLNTAIIRSVARGYDGDYKKVVKVSFYWSLLALPVFMALGGFYYSYESHVIGLLLMIAGVFFPFQYAPNTWDAFLQGQEKFALRARWHSTQAIINTVFLIAIMFFYKNNVFTLILGYFVSYTFFNILWYYKSNKFIRNKQRDLEIFSYGWFLTKLNIIVLIASHIDKLLIGIFIGPEELAIYSFVSLIAIKIKDLFRIPALQLTFPKLSKTNLLFSQLIKKHRLGIIYMFVFSLIIAIGFYFTIPLINNILFTIKYSQYSNLSKLFSFQIFILLPLILMGTYSLTKKNKTVIILTKPIYSIINILINVILIYKFKLLGAVLADNISMYIWFFLFFFGIRWSEKKKTTA